MRAALAGVDVVGERVDRLLVGGVPLHRDLGGAFLALAGEEDDLAVDGVLVLVQVGDEVLDPALVLELGGVALAALVDDRDPQSAREEGGLAQALLERVEVEVERLEDVRVRKERDGGPGDPVAGQLLALLQARSGERRASTPATSRSRRGGSRRRRLFGQRVDDRHADAVQAAGDLVATAVAELAAGVEHGEHDLDRRPALLLVHRDGNPAPVVDDGHRVVGVDRDGDLGAVAGEGLVDGVVDDLVDEVVQTHHAGRADVHARALADGLEAFEDRDVLCVVAGVGLRHRRVVDAALGGASAVRALVACRAVATCGQLSLDDVRTPRNPESKDRGPGRGKCLRNNSTSGP